nr:MAG TPA: hypothetical protein [Bacteriophage sp.]
MRSVGLLILCELRLQFRVGLLELETLILFDEICRGQILWKCLPLLSSKTALWCGRILLKLSLLFCFLSFLLLIAPLLDLPPEGYFEMGFSLHGLVLT